MLRELGDFLARRQRANLLMVAANLAVYLWVVFAGGGNPPRVGYLAGHGAMLPSAIVQGNEYYRLFTSMFLHFSVEHLLSNMLILLFAGDMLQERVGTLRYLLIYLGGGLLGNVLSLAVDCQKGVEVVSAGASGAVFAVIGGLVWLIVKYKGKVPGLDARGVLLMAVLSLVQGFQNVGVDPYAHLGGFLGGFALGAISRASAKGRRR